MAPLNYATLYEQALQQVYKQGLKFSALYLNSQASKYRWNGAKTVQIPSISVGGFVNSNRDIQQDYARNVDNEWTPYTLTHDRTFMTLIDPMDIDETNMITSIANITEVFNTEEKIPEMDKYMASKLYADYVALGGTANTTALTSANILTVIDALMEDMDEAEVPSEGRLMYCTPAIKTMLKEAQDLQRVLNTDSANGNVDRSVNRLEELTIIPVPSVRMKSAYDFTEGAVPSVGADQINFFIVHPSCVLAPQKYEAVFVDPPSAETRGKFKYFERKYWDVFLIEQKFQGYAVNITVVP